MAKMQNIGKVFWRLILLQPNLTNWQPAIPLIRTGSGCLNTTFTANHQPYSTIFMGTSEDLGSRRWIIANRLWCTVGWMSLDAGSISDTITNWPKTTGWHEIANTNCTWDGDCYVDVACNDSARHGVVIVYSDSMSRLQVIGKRYWEPYYLLHHEPHLRIERQRHTVQFQLDTKIFGALR